MADIDITQAEADSLILMEKFRVDSEEWFFPPPGERLSIPLVSTNKREHFVIDVSRVAIKLTKATYQNRARQVIILMRLDIDGSPHRNPDGEDVPCPHLHVYREGYGDKWAFPAPLDRFTNTQDLFKTFEEFMLHCNVTDSPNIQKGLFS